MEQGVEIFNTHADWAIENKTYNKNRVHKDLYSVLRLKYPIVPSALLQAVRDTAMEAVKATQSKLRYTFLNTSVRYLKPGNLKDVT